MRAVVIFVEPDGAARAEAGGREREGEATVVGGAEELIDEWREATDDDEGAAALAGHRCENAPTAAHHRRPAIAQREDPPAIDRDLTRARRGGDHRARVVPTSGRAVAHADAVRSQDRGLGEPEIGSDDEGAAALEERPHRDGLLVAYELRRAQHEHDGHTGLARLEAFALDEHGASPELLEERTEPRRAAARVVERRARPPLGLGVRADEDRERDDRDEENAGQHVEGIDPHTASHATARSARARAWSASSTVAPLSPNHARSCSEISSRKVSTCGSDEARSRSSRSVNDGS